MVNIKGGKGYKKKKKGAGPSSFEVADDNQTYARIVKKLGDKRFLIILHNGTKKVMGRARGGLHGWHNLKEHDVVLVSSRDFRSSDAEFFVQEVYDIINMYSADDVRKLKRIGKITDPAFLDFSMETTSSSANPIDFQMDEVVEESEIAPQREIRMPSSDDSSEEEDNRDVDIDDI
jgi:translation initiation factor IF-1